MIAVACALASASACSWGAPGGSHSAQASSSVKTVTIVPPPARRITALQRAGLMQIRPVLAIYAGGDAQLDSTRPTCSSSCANRVLVRSRRLVIDAVTDEGRHQRLVLGPVIADGLDVVSAKVSTASSYSPYFHALIRGGGGAIAYRLAPQAAARIAAVRAAELTRSGGAPRLQLAVVFEGRIISVGPVTRGHSGSGEIPLPYAYPADAQFAAWLMGRAA
jgi:hypothetical protein